MDERTDVRAVLAELRQGAERAEAALAQLQLRHTHTLMPPPGLQAMIALGALPARLVTGARDG